MMNCSVTVTVPISADAADVVAPEIEQHQVLGPLLRVGQQVGGELAVLRRRRAARPGAGDRADGHLAVAQPHQDLRARADDGEVAEIEEEQEGRGVEPAQRAVEREGRQVEGHARSAGDSTTWKMSPARMYSFARSTMAWNSLAASCWRSAPAGGRRGTRLAPVAAARGRNRRPRRRAARRPGRRRRARRRWACGPDRRDHGDHILDGVEDRDDRRPQEHARRAGRARPGCRRAGVSISRTMS